MSTFALEIAAWVEATKAKADEAVGRLVANVAADLDFASPVGDGSYWISPPPKGYVGGHFRANWQLGIDSIPSGEIDGVDPRGEMTLGRIAAKIPEAAAGHVYYLVNNAPYAQRLEEGHSRQAPLGIVELATIGWQAKVDRAVVTLNGK